MTVELLNDFQRRLRPCTVKTSHVQGSITSLVRDVNALGIGLQQEPDNLEVLGMMTNGNEEGRRRGRRGTTTATTTIGHAENLGSCFGQHLKDFEVELDLVLLAIGLMKECQIDR